VHARWPSSEMSLLYGRTVASNALVAILTAIATLAAVAVVAAAPFTLNLPALLGGFVLAAGFGTARVLAVEVEVRRDSVRITPTEIPLVIGLTYLPGPVVMMAYVGVVVIARLLRRDNWAKLAFNASYATLTVAITYLLCRMVFEASWPQLPRWVAVLAGFVIAHTITSMLTWAFLVLLDHRRPGECVRPVMHLYLIGLLNAALGVTAVDVLEAPWGTVLVGLLTVSVTAAYSVYYRLLRDHRDLGLLNALSLRVALVGRGSAEGQSELDESAWSMAMELTREQLNASRVVLHRLPPHSGKPAPHESSVHESAQRGLYTVVAGLPLPRPLSEPDITALLILGPRPGAGQVRRLVASGPNPVINAALVAREAREILVAPLQGAGQLLGVIEVHDRHSHMRGFGAADVRLVETLSSHLSTALDNCRLVGQLRYDAYHDSLTDLRNRLGFREAANEVLRNGSAPCAVLVIELGLLSAVNDALGQAWGDRVVLGAGDRLCRTLDPRVLTARLEGDTFAALLSDIDSHQALAVAEQVQAALSKPYPLDKLAVECTAVVGVALTGIEPTRDANQLLQRADVALRAARSAETTVRTYQPSMGQVLVRRFQLVTQFRQALDIGQVDVHFQPQLALLSRQVIGVEALVRWTHPEFGMVNPAEFVTLVETTGLIDPLTEYVLNRSLAQCRSWLDRGMKLTVSVNLSVRNLADAEFPRRVREALQRHRVPAALLGLELTESAVMSDPEHALPVLRGLHGLGVRIAVDDFGTGYSSLAYLRRLPVDEVKIDKSFVVGLASDLGDLAVVRAIIELGHSLGLTVVAEGVEQDATRDQLVEMGCDIVQGYLISRPLGPDRFDAWLSARTIRALGTRDDTVLTLVP
jgi:diguanylate cyclase (GGDEF)-like protein